MQQQKLNVPRHHCVRGEVETTDKIKSHSLFALNAKQMTPLIAQVDVNKSNTLLITVSAKNFTTSYLLAEVQFLLNR